MSVQQSVIATLPAKHAANSAKHAGGQAHHSVLPHWLIHLGALGLFAVAILDSSPIPLPLPGSTDLLLLLLVSHRGSFPILLAASAIIGSGIGGYITWSAGKKGGEALLHRTVPARFREHLERWAKEHSILSVFLAAVLPPPIPLTPFLLAAGVLGIPRNRFLGTLIVARTVRYGLITWAGIVYGRRVVDWWTTNLAGWSGVIGWTFAILLVSAVSYGIWQYRRQQQESGEQAFA